MALVTPTTSSCRNLMDPGPLFCEQILRFPLNRNLMRKKFLTKLLWNTSSLLVRSPAMGRVDPCFFCRSYSGKGGGLSCEDPRGGCHGLGRGTSSPLNFMGGGSHAAKTKGKTCPGSSPWRAEPESKSVVRPLLAELVLQGSG